MAEACAAPVFKAEREIKKQAFVQSMIFYEMIIQYFDAAIKQRDPNYCRKADISMYQIPAALHNFESAI